MWTAARPIAPKRLKELRQDPQFYKALNEGEPPLRFQGGAGYEDAIRRIEEEERMKFLYLRMFLYSRMHDGSS